ncbi:MAG: hypothetical protein QE272_06595 [Nevskia sp.]|nr:hypothetical protein [Nevskia sp.]
MEHSILPIGCGKRAAVLIAAVAVGAHDAWRCLSEHRQGQNDDGQTHPALQG